MGAGCTFSASIAAELAKGQNISAAMVKAKSYVTAAIEGSFKLNDHVGAMRHWR